MSEIAEGIEFDIHDVPFSFFGSWMSIAIPRGEDNIFLRNCHNGSHNVFPIQMMVKGKKVEPEITVNPTSMRLTHGEAHIEICFESDRTIRMRGHGAGLKLGDSHLVYSEAPNRVVINCRGALRRYQVEMLSGSVDIKRLTPAQPFFPVIAVISPSEDGRWELAIDEFWSTWKRPERKSFDEVLAATKDMFQKFLNNMPASRPEDQKARELASYINWSCAVGPCGLIKRPTMLMSKNWMCNVWSWDQCFNGMAAACGEPELALDQMLTLVDHQDEFGSYPDSINDHVLHYNYSKPPVHGWAFGEILARLPELPSQDVIETMYISLGRQADWWMTNRRKDGARLPYYLHGNDSGWDNSTMFNHGVPLVAPDLSSFLVLQMDELCVLAQELRKAEEAAEWKRRADELFSALMEELWSGDHFIARLANDGTPVESESLIPWLPIILGERLSQEVRDLLKSGIEAHLTEWGLATEKINSPNYNSDGYWQGPIWGPSTFIAVSGLASSGFNALADEVSERFCRLCAKSGFPENYDAVTGDSLCDPAYTWTASVFLLLAERLYNKE